MSTLNRSVAPEVKPLSGISMPPLKSYTLSNGVRFNMFNGGDCEVNRLSVVIDGGVAEDDDARRLALMNSVSTEGTAGYTAEDVAEILDYNGSWLTTSESVHHSTRTFFSLNKNIDNVLPVIGQIVCEPTFNQRQVDVACEKAARLIELKRRKVKYCSSSLLDKMIFKPGQPLAIQPSPEAVRSVSPSELRHLYSKALSSSRIHVFLAGKISDSLESTVASFFESIATDSPGIAARRVIFAPAAPPHTASLVVPGALQSAVDAGMPVIGRDNPDYDMLRMAVVILGGYFGSRLMMNIREEKGYTYGISAALMGYRDCGQVRISTETDNAYVESVIREIRCEMERMHDPSTYTPEELLRVRSFIESTLASQLDTPFSVMDYHMTRLTIGAPEGYFDNQLKVLSVATPESLAEISRRYLNPDNLYFAVAGGNEPS